MLTRRDIYQLVNDYIGVSGGYLGDFSYRTHHEFYPYFCDLDIDPSEIEGTTRERFIQILENASPAEQAKILRGTFEKYPVDHFPEEERAQKRSLHMRFQRIITRLEKMAASPSDVIITAAVENYGAGYVQEVWQRALERRNEDPEAAITAARTLLESTCKHILDDLGVTYEDRFDLPKLYRLTAEQLNLAPSQHTEHVFKQILGGCQTVVEGLGAVRNKLSDAHGKGRRPVKPAPRHAELAVNLAGTMATFLIETWEMKTDGEENAKR